MRNSQLVAAGSHSQCLRLALASQLEQEMTIIHLDLNQSFDNSNEKRKVETRTRARAPTNARRPTRQRGGRLARRGPPRHRGKHASKSGMVQTGAGPEPQGAPPCQLPLASAFGPRLTRAPPQKYASKPANSRTFSRVVVAQTRTLAVSSCVVVAQTRTLAVSSSAVAVDCLSLPKPWGSSSSLQ